MGLWKSNAPNRQSDGRQADSLISEEMELLVAHYKKCGMYLIT